MIFYRRKKKITEEQNINERKLYAFGMNHSTRVVIWSKISGFNPWLSKKSPLCPFFSLKATVNIWKASQITSMENLSRTFLDKILTHLRIGRQVKGRPLHTIPYHLNLSLTWTHLSFCSIALYSVQTLCNPFVLTFTAHSTKTAHLE